MTGPPLTVLHVCAGNTCRSPMAERLLALRAAERDLTVYNHSCGVDHRQAGSAMNPPAVAEVTARGGSADGFRARHIAREYVEMSDVILVATGEQARYFDEAFPDAVGRVFPLLHFAAIVADVDPEELPTDPDPDAAVAARGAALVTIAAGRREDHPVVDVPDPWGRDPSAFAAVASTIDEAVTLLASRLDPAAVSPWRV